MTDQQLKTHYKFSRQIHLCGLAASYRSIGRLERVALVTCRRCQRSLVANGGGMVKYQKSRVVQHGGRRFRLPGKVVPN
jgi:hypothetical protein